MATRIDPKEQAFYKKELISTMLQRAGVTEKEIYEEALKNWINRNLDLLTKDELLEYRKKGIIKYNKVQF